MHQNRLRMPVETVSFGVVIPTSSPYIIEFWHWSLKGVAMHLKFADYSGAFRSACAIYFRVCLFLACMCMVHARIPRHSRKNMYWHMPGVGMCMPRMKSICIFSVYMHQNRLRMPHWDGFLFWKWWPFLEKFFFLLFKIIYLYIVSLHIFPVVAGKNMYWHMPRVRMCMPKKANMCIFHCIYASK